MKIIINCNILHKNSAHNSPRFDVLEINNVADNFQLIPIDWNNFVLAKKPHDAGYSDRFLHQPFTIIRAVLQPAIEVSIFPDRALLGQVVLLPRLQRILQTRTRRMNAYVVDVQKPGTDARRNGPERSRLETEFFIRSKLGQEVLQVFNIAFIQL